MQTHLADRPSMEDITVSMSLNNTSLRVSESTKLYETNMSIDVKHVSLRSILITEGIIIIQPNSLEFWILAS